MYAKYFKSPFDIILGVIIFLLILPIFVLIMLLLCLNGDKPFFIQHRPGKNGRIFKIIKFKTMNDRKDLDGNLLPNRERLTGIGKHIRKTSLDELPQLINVIKGDMSFVGPRPLRIEYMPYYSSEQARRHNVKPGITGWAQVNGRNSLSWDEKFKMDVWYVDNISLVLDIRILFLTFWKVFKQEGINTDANVFMEPFKGVKLNG